MPAYIFCFFLGALLGFFASEFADRWGCSQRYRSTLPKKLFIVLLSGTGAACLYLWEVEYGMLLPHDMPKTTIFTMKAALDLHVVFFTRYVFHLVLFTFLLAATLTDFCEMSIPDSITVFGTILAICSAPMFPLSALPVTEMYWSNGFLVVVPQFITKMHVWSPNPVGTSSLIAMTLLWWFWSFAMLDRVWYTKLPFRKASTIFLRYLYRSPSTKFYVISALFYPPFVAFFLADLGPKTALFSALVGMAAGMILIWGIRLAAHWVLGIEAMGFGDVTLMGMIGAFLGWQAVLLIFFLAPFFGLVYGIINWMLGRGRAVPYGPFLCLATVTIVVFWRFVWGVTAEYFSFGIGVIGVSMLVLLVLFGILLHVVHQIMARSHR
jgi:prepilin signal peptidase PulO-like enzyme (type II secretory pathway)